MDNFLAKSNLTFLGVHSRYTCLASLAMFRQNSSLEVYDRYKRVIKIISYLHDIGKCTVGTQSYLGGGVGIMGKYYHNQVGAAFLANHLVLDFETKFLVLNSVYWHHGIYKSGTYDEIYSTLSSEDISNMSIYLCNILGSSYLSTEIIDDINFISPSSYFLDDRLKNINLIMLRSFVIGGDRLVSSLSVNDLNLRNISDKISLSLNKSRNVDIDLCDCVYKNSDRFLEQQRIAMSCNGTSIINAPAGFGKTMLGLLWGFRSRKKIIWVCPRNMVAESVYHSILGELGSLGLGDISVELYLGGEIKDSIGNANLSGDCFGSDIIVTNIDNFLFTSINNSKLNHLYLTNDVNVVFDEYHELVSNAGFMSLFVYIMSIRHNLLNSNTLLLSATYLPINTLWDLPDNKTNILPGEYMHYNSAHSKPYRLNIIEEPKFGSNSLTILNSISLAQRYKIESCGKYLMHSKFENSERDLHFKTLLDLYGKGSERNIEKPFIIGTRILDSSLDMSFGIINESIFSPEHTMQGIGRGNRWGDYNDNCIINIFKSSSKSEREVIHNLYDLKLNGLWFDYISKYNGLDLTLDELYVIYDTFSRDNKDKIKSFVRGLFKDSGSNISNIYPVKYLGSSDCDYYTTKSNKLRCKNNDMFVIYEKSDNSFTEVFTQSVYSNISKEFGESGSTLPFMIKKMRSIKDERYDYSYLEKRNKSQRDSITLDDIRGNSIRSNSPYMRFDCVYRNDLGVIKRDLLKKYNIL